MSKVNTRSFAVVSALYYFGNAYVVGSNAGSGRDDWLCIAIAAIIELPILFLMAVLAERFPEKDLFQIMRDCFGERLLRFFALLYGVYGILLLSMSLSSFSRYVCTCVLLQTPRYVMSLLLAICVFLFIRRGAAGICRSAPFLFLTIALVLTVSFAASGTSVHFSNLLPIGYTEGLARGVYRSTAFPFAEPLILFSLLSTVKRGVRKKHWIFPFVLTMLVLTLNVMRTVMILGDGLSEILSFPTTYADSIAAYESLEQRFEVITTMIPAAAALVEASLAALFAVQALETLTNTREKDRICAFVCVLGAGLSVALYRTQQQLDWRIDVWPMISISLQLFIVLLCLLRSMGMERRSKAKIFLHSLKKTMK